MAKPPKPDVLPASEGNPYFAILAGIRVWWNVGKTSERMGAHNVGSQSSALPPHRTDRHRAHFHIWHLSVEHRLALRLDVGAGPLPLSDDDHWYLRDARRIPFDGVARSGRA